MQKELENYAVQGGTDPRLIPILTSIVTALDKLNERTGKLEAAENLAVQSASQADLEAIDDGFRALARRLDALTVAVDLKFQSLEAVASEAPINSPEPTPSGEGDATPQGEVV